MSFEILPWSEISDQFGDNLLLGNGASIAVDERFRYRSLKEHAIENGLFSEDVQSLFDFFRTNDFELVLRIVWQSTNVNAALGIEDEKTEQAYRHVRDCLIDAVRDIHPEYGEVEDHLPAIASFMRCFKTIVSLNCRSANDPDEKGIANNLAERSVEMKHLELLRLRAR